MHIHILDFLALRRLIKFNIPRFLLVLRLPQRPYHSNSLYSYIH